jgi:hypothetical protein
MFTGGLAACAQTSEKAALSPLEELDDVLAPVAAAGALRRAGGGHFKATTTFEVHPRQPGPAYDPERDAVTTDTELWMDKDGHYRLLETNDRDGGREVVLSGKELALGLRHGKLIKRNAREPEPTRYLEEALGGPWAAWELMRRFASVERVETPGPVGSSRLYRVKKADSSRATRGSLEEATPLRRWRDTVTFESLGGEVRLDSPTGIVLAARLEGRFSLVRDGTPLDGTVRVQTKLEEIGAVPPIDPPVPPVAEELRSRQRTILEERALLGRTATDSPAVPGPKRTR